MKRVSDQLEMQEVTNNQAACNTSSAITDERCRELQPITHLWVNLASPLALVLVGSVGVAAGEESATASNNNDNTAGKWVAMYFFQPY